MKFITYITHPLLIVTYFLLILISGESNAGFYCFYILLALPHGGIHAVLGFAGLGLLIFSYAKYKNTFNYLIESILNISGALLLIFSLFTFFYNDVDHYNYGTFNETVPLIILIIFLLIVVIFLIKNFNKFRSRRIAT